MNYHVCNTDPLSTNFMGNDFLSKIIDFYRFNDKQLKQIFEEIEIEDISDNVYINKVKDRLSVALLNNEKIFVCGDYDADGICATAMIVNFLRIEGSNCGYYIPNRLKDGYGLSCDLVEKVKQKGYQLIITVDNGVKAHDALKLAESYGMDVIILDHHIIEDRLEHNLIIHPDLLPESYTGLCGAGVVLQLIKSFDHHDPLYEILAMVATIADMVEMFNANRLITINGLQLLNTIGFLPINAILKVNDQINEETIAYQFIPAINTVGRLADIANANVVVEYLLATDPKIIYKTAKSIMELNDKRKNMVNNADNDKDQTYHLPNYDVFLSDDYHEGIIGLLANRFMIEQTKPTLVGTNNKDTYKFSGRSIKGFDIYESLYQYQSLFSAFGGHKQACGFSISQDRFAEFIELLQKEDKLINDEKSQRVIKIDISELVIDNIELLDKLRPFGTGIKKPLFMLDEQEITKITMIKNRYPKATIKTNTCEIEMISFKKEFVEDNNKTTKKVVGYLSINEYRGKRSISFLVDDVLF